jgi:hypothetical protein
VLTSPYQSTFTLHTDPETGEVRRHKVHTMVWSGYLRRLKDVQPSNHWMDILINRATNKAGSHGIMPEAAGSNKKGKRDMNSQQTAATSTATTTATATSTSTLESSLAKLTGQTQREDQSSASGGAYVGKDSEGKDVLIGPAGTPLSHYSDPHNQLEQAREEELAEKLFANAGTEGRHPAEPDEAGFVDGFAAIISPSFTWPHLNLRQYDFLSMNMKTDGRAYCFNVRCRNSTQDVWVGRINADPLHASKPYLRKLEIEFNKLWGTSKGRPMLIPKHVNQSAIQSFGFSVTGEEGPFRLEIECIVAHQGEPDYTILSKRRRSIELEQEEQRQAMQAARDAANVNQPLSEAAQSSSKQQRIADNAKRVNELFQQDYQLKNQQPSMQQGEGVPSQHRSTQRPQRKSNDIEDY